MTPRTRQQWTQGARAIGILPSHHLRLAVVSARLMSGTLASAPAQRRHSRQTRRRPHRQTQSRPHRRQVRTTATACTTATLLTYQLDILLSQSIPISHIPMDNSQSSDADWLSVVQHLGR